MISGSQGDKNKHGAWAAKKKKTPPPTRVAASPVGGDFENPCVYAHVLTYTFLVQTLRGYLEFHSFTGHITARS